MRMVCGWIYAIDKYGYPPSIKNTYKVLSEMAAMGFNYVEMEGISIEGLNEGNLMEIARNKIKIKSLCDNLGIKICTFLPIIPNLVSMDKNKRKQALSLFETGVEVAEYFGSNYLYSDSFTPPLKFIGEAPYKKTINFGREFKVKIDPKFNWQKQWDILVESLSICNEKAKSSGKRFIIEPRAGEMVSNTDGLLRLLDIINDDNFGVLFDTAHLYPQKEILPLSIEKLGKKIFYLHVADSDGITNRHLPIGSGTIDWDGVFAALRKHKFKGDIGIDIGKTLGLEKAFIKAMSFVKRHCGLK